MSIRPKVFLTCSLFCIGPLLILSIVSFRNQAEATDVLVRANLQDELANVTDNFDSLVRARKHELMALAEGPVRDLLLAVRRKPNATGRVYQTSATPAVDSGSAFAGEAAVKTSKAVTRLLSDQHYYASVTVYDFMKRALLVAEPEPGKPEGTINFRTKDFLPSQIPSDEQVWKTTDLTPRIAVVANRVNGATLRCTVPLPTKEGTSNERGALVADLKLDAIVAEAARSWEANLARGSATEKGSSQPNSRMVAVLDRSGRIVYHTNDAFKYQLVNTAFPSFATVAGAMMSGQSGSSMYTSSAGQKWLVAYAPLGAGGLSLAVASNYSLVAHGARIKGWIGVALSLMIGLAATVLLALFYQRKTQSLERVTQGVRAIAGGQLDQQLLLNSSDEMRSLADNVNLVTNRLREQFAREAEARQFESFVKLSALLTHDLKNAIEALSLMVSNMERHFDNPKFRADAMNALTGATDKLRGLVTRLSNPVNTLSGEFKLPRPTDLVPLLRRVLAQIAEPVGGTHEIEVKLPLSLFALADNERIEKVMENLVLNAVEAVQAMPGKSGKLTVEAGRVSGGKVFFSISDTGKGMSPEFIRQRLFRPFATTKSRGVGLGLYTCREVVRANGGAIEVESKEGSGTTFRVVLASAQIKERA